MAFYGMAQQFFDSLNIYDRNPINSMYVYNSPFFAMLMLPFLILPAVVAAYGWFVLKVFGYRHLFSYFLNKIRDLDKYKWHFALPLLLLLSHIHNEFRLGQVNFHLTILLFLSFLFLRQKKSILASVCFFVSTVKLTPLFFLPYFLLKKEWKFLINFVSLCLAFTGLFLLRYGVQDGLEVLNTLVNITGTKKGGAAEAAFYQNQSLLGALSRSLPEALIEYRMYFWLIIGSIIGAICYLPSLLEKKPQFINFSILVFGMLLLSPDTRSAHLVSLILPFFAFMDLNLNRATNSFKNNLKFYGPYLIGAIVLHKSSFSESYLFHSALFIALLMQLLYLFYFSLKHTNSRQ